MSSLTKTLLAITLLSLFNSAVIAKTQQTNTKNIQVNKNKTSVTNPSSVTEADDNSLELTEDEQVSEVPVEAIQQFIKVYQVVQQNYVNELNDEQLFNAAIKGLVNQDNYSRYLNMEDYQDLIRYTEGGEATVDFELIKKNNHWVINQLREDSATTKLGLKNDLAVYRINEQNINQLNAEQVQNLLLGAMGSTLTIQLGENTQPIKLIRNKAQNTDIRSKLMLQNQVLYIHIPVFKQETANEIKNAIYDVAHLPVQAILLDLRNNPGGLLSSAVETSELFLKQGLIVSTKSRAEGNQNFRALSKMTFEHKLGIIINHKSASAAEVFTAAMQQNQRAYVMGEKSYGKGVVQKVLPLDNGDAVSLTVAHYYTPNGQQLDGKGIIPNLLSPRNQLDDDEYLEKMAEALLQHSSKR